MNDNSLPGLLAGPFTFLQPDCGEFERLFGAGLSALPHPQRIFLEDEEATPFEGFPVLNSAGAQDLRQALEEFIYAEEELQVVAVRRQRFERDRHSEAWQLYRRLLRRAVENATLSSYGRRYPSIFWLAHSLDVARLLKETPRRVVRLDLEVGRSEGRRIKYRVFDKFLDRAQAASQETLRSLGPHDHEAAQDFTNTLLRQLAENVLIFTEDHVSSDLRELSAYLSGYLDLDAGDFLRRFQELHLWHEQLLVSEPELAVLTQSVLGLEEGHDPRIALFRRGYSRYLASRPDYDPLSLLSSPQIEHWEKLLDQLKRFEILRALRRQILPVSIEKDRQIYLPNPGDQPLKGRREIVFSPSTRPLDFASPWVIDPVVHRHGLIYDVTDFSRVVSQMRRTGRDAQEHGYRMMFRFQRQVNLLARQYKLKLEKFLGDGAFFTSRHPLLLVACAVRLQRTYISFLKQGLPFDCGLRMGLNSSHYRLMPIHTPGESDLPRYDFFGHGVVELSRLTSGKTEEKLEAIQNLMISRGYPAETVHRFFAPLVGPDSRKPQAAGQQSSGLGGGISHDSPPPFSAVLNGNGMLVNEGIVATADLVAQLDDALGSRLLYQTRLRDLPYVMVPIDDKKRLLFVGIRKLGVARLKGLDDLTVYELVDGGSLGTLNLRPLRRRRLIAALDELTQQELGR